MPQTWNILVTIDAAGIIGYYGTGEGLDPINPYVLPSTPFVRMISINIDNKDNPPRQVIASNGSDELNLPVKTGDRVEWRETSLTKGDGYEVALYHFQGNPSNDPDNQPFDYKPYLSQPQARVYPVSLEMPPDGQAADGSWGSPPLTKTENTHWVWWADTRKASADLPGGALAYSWSFMIWNRDDNPGPTYQYFRWDPYLTITD